jgi:hypothetical protein
MTKRTFTVVGATFVALCAVLSAQPWADAHHPEVEVSCLSGPATIRVSAVAWDTLDPDERANDKIEVTYDGRVIGVGAFTATNGYAFTLDYAAPDLRGTHVIRATSVHAWGPTGKDPDPIGIGEFREATVELPCGTTVITSTTDASPPAAAPTATTTTPPLVLGVTETRAETGADNAAVAIPANPRFAG